MKMNLKVANDRIIVLESQINNILNKKECEKSKVLPQATVYKKDAVFTSRVEKTNFYIISLTIKNMMKNYQCFRKKKKYF